MEPYSTLIMKNRLLLLIYLVISFMLINISCKSGKKGDIIGLNKNIHHDDFEYSVTSFSTTPKIKTDKDTILANGIFYIIHFKVVNNAIRVGHQWDNSIAYLVDGKGNRYENINDNQIALNKSIPFNLKEEYNTPHGTADTTILVFDLPSDAREPYLMIRGGILMGDVFNAGRFRRMKVKLF